MRYFGGSWHQIRTNAPRQRILRHEDDQVLVGLKEGFLTLDRGRLVEYTNEWTREQAFLLGESGFRPFDEAFYQAHQADFFPARKTRDAVYVFRDHRGLEAFREDDLPPGTARFSKYFDRLWLAEGGYWAHCDNRSELQRYYEGLLLTVDLSVTPVATGFYAFGCDVHEDANDDLWLRRQSTLFRVRSPKLDTRIVTPQPDASTSARLCMEFTGTAARPIAEPLRYAWRLDDGPWSEPSEQTTARLEFTEPGTHTFEVLSIGPMASLDITPAATTVHVTLPVPEVRIVSAPQGIVTDLDVTITYELVKRPPGADVTFQWRTDGGSWQETQDTVVRLPALTDGRHTFEVRAVGDGKYVQTPPERVDLNAQVDYDRAIVRAIEGLRSSDYDQREAAARRLVFLGERSVPHLSKCLDGADSDTSWWIRAVLAEIEGR
jgi:hypothetical protein